MYYIIYQTAFTGDIILSASMLHTIKQADPDGKIIFITTPAGSTIFRNDKRIDHLISYDKRKKDKGISGFLRIRKEILKITKYDSVYISPHRFLRATILGLLTGSRIRAGFNSSSLSFLYNRKTEYKGNVHEIERNFELLKTVFSDKLYESKPERPVLFLSDNDKNVAGKKISGMFDLNASDLKLISIAPGSVWSTKRWPAGYFKELILLLNVKGFKVLLIGGKEEKKLCDFLLTDNTLNLAGELNLLESAAAIGMSHAIISNDSTPIHLASATNTPTIAIFGPTLPSFGFTPLSDKRIILEDKSVACRPCGKHGSNQCREGHFKCMRSVRPEMVLNALMKIIEK